MDVLAVQAAAEQALDYVRGGNGPYILEMMTYRFRGHSMSDPAKYRTKEELSSYKDEKDPVTRMKGFMIEELKVKEDDIKALEKDVKATVNEAAQFAQETPEPDESELWTDILKPVEDVA